VVAESAYGLARLIPSRIIRLSRRLRLIPSRYLDAVRSIADHLESTQLPAIEQASQLVIESMTRGGAVYCSEIGHGNQLDFMNGAGGLAAVQPFSFTVKIEAPAAECVADRPRAEPVETDIESVRFAVRNSSLRSGDVMLVSSVSGRGRAPIELAMACRQIGVRVIGFTSMRYASQVESTHPSGKKLCEVVDVPIDIGAPFGDAAVEIPGYDFKLLPVSGVGMICAGWMIWGRVMELMAKSGNPPTVFMSVNRPGGQDHHQASLKQFNQRGY
jgi:uncharacterized phosphosugar-binding protein